MSHKTISALSVAAALSGALSFSAISAPSFAMEDAMNKTDSMAGGMMADHAYDGRCWGVAKAGENDCGSKAEELKTTFGLDAPTTAHDCAGQATGSFDGTDFKKVGSAEDCTAMHGSLTPFVGMNDKMGM